MNNIFNNLSNNDKNALIFIFYDFKDYYNEKNNGKIKIICMNIIINIIKLKHIFFLFLIIIYYLIQINKTFIKLNYLKNLINAKDELIEKNYIKIF